MRLFVVCAPLLLYAQGRLKIGREVSSQGILTGVDTVFRLSGPSLALWVEMQSSAPLEWDTLWVVVRSIEKPPGFFRLYRSKGNPLILRGRAVFRQGGIYYLTVSPPRQPRLILGRGRVYITDAQTPTIAALRARTQQQAQSSAQIGGITAPDLSATMEDIELMPESLISGNETLPPMDEDLLEDTTDLTLDLPEDGMGVDEDFELEDLDLEDL